MAVAGSVAAAFAAAVLAALVVALVAYFNRGILLRNRCDESWANVDTELRRRYELVPNLVETVKGYARHERAVLDAVVAARSRAAQTAGAVDRQADAERPLVAALDRLLAVAEGYPDLKASSNFLKLQHELAITEDRIQANRRFFNANVRDYRNHTRQFPGVLLARLFRFGPLAFFEVEAVHGVAPRVEA
jgi:LemA protein